MLDSPILLFPLKVTHTCQDWFPPFAQNKLHSFSLTQLDDCSQLKFCHVGFIQFAKKKNFNLSFSLNLMMAAILNSAILNSAILVFFLKLTHTCQDWFPPFAQNNFTHSFWLNLMMAAILDSVMLVSDTAILDSDTLLSSLRFTQNTLIPLWIWLKLIQSDSNSFILTELDDGSHLERFRHCHLGFRPLLSSLRFTQKHSHSTLTLTQTNSIWLTLIHSHLTWWWQPSWILPSWIWPCWIQPS